MLIKRISILLLFVQLNFTPLMASDQTTTSEKVQTIESAQSSDPKIADLAGAGSPLTKFGALTGVTLLISLVVFMASRNWHEKRQSR